MLWEGSQIQFGCCRVAGVCSSHPSLGGPEAPAWEGRNAFNTYTLFLGKLQDVCLPWGRDPVPGFIAGGWTSSLGLWAPWCSRHTAQAVELNGLVCGLPAARDRLCGLKQGPGKLNFPAVNSYHVAVKMWRGALCSALSAVTGVRPALLWRYDDYCLLGSGYITWSLSLCLLE